MAALICPDGVASCTDVALCRGCYGRTLVVARRQARVIGAWWAERTARRRELRGEVAWPDTPKAFAIARRLVATLVRDARMHDELAAAALAGAAAWWATRPARYRA